MLVSNKIVDVVALNNALNTRCKDTNLSKFENKQEFSDFVEDFVVENVEKVAFELENLDWYHGNIEDVVDNINEFRDAQADFVDQKWEELEA